MNVHIIEINSENSRAISEIPKVLEVFRLTNQSALNPPAIIHAKNGGNSHIGSPEFSKLNPEI
jgi:hypothetical protein